MQFLRTSRAAHAADSDWGMIAFKGFLTLAGIWFAVAVVTYYVAGYEGLTVVAKPFTALGEWKVGMDMAYPGVLNTIMICILGLVALAMVTTAIRHELARMRTEREHQAQSAAYSRQIEDEVASAAHTLRTTDDIVYCITTVRPR